MVTKMGFHLLILFNLSVFGSVENENNLSIPINDVQVLLDEMDENGSLSVHKASNPTAEANSKDNPSSSPTGNLRGSRRARSNLVGQFSETKNSFLSTAERNHVAESSKNLIGSTVLSSAVLTQQQQFLAAFYKANPLMSNSLDMNSFLTVPNNNSCLTSSVIEDNSCHTTTVEQNEVTAQSRETERSPEKRVVIFDFHGIGDWARADYFTRECEYLTEKLTEHGKKMGTNQRYTCHSIEYGAKTESFNKSITDQIETACRNIYENKEQPQVTKDFEAADKVILIGYSNGCIIARGVLQYCSGIGRKVSHIALVGGPTRGITQPPAGMMEFGLRANPQLQGLIKAVNSDVPLLSRNPTLAEKLGPVGYIYTPGTWRYFTKRKQCIFKWVFSMNNECGDGQNPDTFEDLEGFGDYTSRNDASQPNGKKKTPGVKLQASDESESSAHDEENASTANAFSEETNSSSRSMSMPAKMTRRTSTTRMSSFLAVRNRNRIERMGKEGISTKTTKVSREKKKSTKTKPPASRKQDLDTIVSGEVRKRMKQFATMNKAMIQNLEGMLLVQFAQDTVISPPASSWMGLEKRNPKNPKQTAYVPKNVIVQMEDSGPWWDDDYLGLRYLKDKNRLKFYLSSGAHMQFANGEKEQGLLSFLKNEEWSKTKEQSAPFQIRKNQAGRQYKKGDAVTIEMEREAFNPKKGALQERGDTDKSPEEPKLEKITIYEAEDGTLQDQHGNPVNNEGDLIDKDGNPLTVDENGNYPRINADNHVYRTDRSGNLMDEVGHRIDAHGNILDSTGKPIYRREAERDKVDARPGAEAPFEVVVGATPQPFQQTNCSDSFNVDP